MRPLSEMIWSEPTFSVLEIAKHVSPDLTVYVFPERHVGAGVGEAVVLR